MHTPPPETLLDKTFVPYLLADALEARIATMAQALNTAYAEQTVLLMPVLTGALRFTAALLPHLQFPYQLACVQIGTYGQAMQAQAQPQYLLAPPQPLPPLPILLLEDIVDQGHTLDFLVEDLQARGATAVACASLLFKPAAHKGRHRPQHIGFEIPTAFVVGYGLDYAQQGRHLPHIYQLAP